ncbi:MAG: methyl-accepting chemotaxis protein [Saliniramus fredricksonii]|uniref:Methyl-accepting chemotaxis protein n=2 Tax=Saliniramus fredricksonii TaxID=1653334 RepID=A0A0N8KEJ6_9HYPH|nr:MAG: methyl-accepting chemotaxis protein [Saliniramus fredricksonii]SCC82429.1 methyl-accepting chemotaxis sensory transducer [Saliniramus fredricksonii]
MMGNFMKRISIKARIGWSFGLVLLVFAGVAGNATLSLFKAEHLFDDYREVASGSSELMDMRGDIYSARVSAAAFLRDGDEADLERARSMLDETFAAYGDLRNSVTREEFATALDGLHAAASEYQTLFDRLVREGRSGEAAVEQLEATGIRTTAMISDTAQDFQNRRVAIGPVIKATLVSAERIAIFATVIGLVIGAVFAFILSRSIVNPVAGLTAAMKRVSSGDLATEIPARDRTDEVGAMAMALAVFRDALQRNQEMEAEAEAREARAEADKKAALAQLADEFEQKVGGLVRQLSSSSAELEATARSLSSTAEETNMQSASVASAAEQTAANVQAVATATEQLAASSQEIGSQVAQAATRSAAAVDQARETNGLVTELSDSAQKIGEVIAMIRAIAEQTNLLALNATIEAARAGEAGKGFAVVAAEVKGLADQTAKATDQIATQITGMQGISEKSVAAIGAIAQQIEQMSALAGSVAAAVEEQQAATGEIARNVSEAARGTQEATGNISQVREASGHTASASEQLLTSANELSENAGSLETEVSQFLQRVRAG